MILALENATKRYPGPEMIEAVRGVSLSIGQGEIVVLFGPSGSGKSTLLMLATGVLVPDEGRVLCSGRDLADLSTDGLAARLRDDIGVSYQDAHLLSGHTVLDNVALKLVSGPTRLRDARRAARPWLARTGLSHRLQHDPRQLSGGEKQRVSLARALVSKPDLLLLDEPTASLDSERTSQMFDLIADAAKSGTGVLLVTHDRAAERIATRLVELRDGRVAHELREQAA